jgi:hypothetical protein
MKVAAAVLAALVVIGLILAMSADWSNRQLDYYEKVQDCVNGSRTPDWESVRMECERVVKEKY